MRDALAGELVRRRSFFRQAGNYASLRDYTAARDGGVPLPPIRRCSWCSNEFSELLCRQARVQSTYS